MKHNYIDLNLVRNFDKKKEGEDVYEDLFEKYQITNLIDDDEIQYHICEVLLEDYNRGLANYEAYIETGMNARMLMELRKNALLVFDKEHEDFYELNSKCETPEEVKELRRGYINKLNSDYMDFNWQYYFLLVFIWRAKSKGVMFDFESYYEDGEPNKQTYLEDYRCDFVASKLKPEDAIKMRYEHYGYDIGLGGQW